MVCRCRCRVRQATRGLGRQAQASGELGRLARRRLHSAHLQHEAVPCPVSRLKLDKYLQRRGRAGQARAGQAGAGQGDAQRMCMWLQAGPGQGRQACRWV